MINLITNYLEIIESVAIIVGVALTYVSVRKISRSVDASQKANTISVLGYFTKEYDSIMEEAIECNTQKKVATWYLRYWNLLTNEFLFFRNGLLEDSIFGFWVFRLCLYYDEKPSDIPLSRIDTFKKSHLKYIEEKNGNCSHADSFFKEVIKISEKKDRDEIKKLVRKLVKKHNN